MEIKDWRQYKKVLSQKMQDDSAFTLIELIVVMAIIAILVLLAAPQFLGYTSKAKDAQIANDIAVVEMVTTEKLIDHKWADENYDDEWWNVDIDSGENGDTIDRDYIYDKYIRPDAERNEEDKGKKIHNKNGLIDPDEEGFDLNKVLPEGEYRVVPKDFIDENTGSDLDGTYIANKDGEVFFIPDVVINGRNDSSSTGDESGNGDNDDTGGGSNQGDEYDIDEYGGYERTPGGIEWVDEMKDLGYDMAQQSDFVWVKESEWNQYWYYIGTKDKVIVPLVLEDNQLSSHRNMFKETHVTAVASNNPQVSNMSSMFIETLSSSLDISNINTSNVTDMGAMFASTKASSIHFGDIDTSSVTTMASMFADTQNLKTIDLSSLDTSNVEDMSYMFSYTGFQELDLSGFDTRSVTDMQGMFEWSFVLHTLDVSNFDVSKVEYMHNMFSGLNALNYVDLSSFDLDYVDRMGGTRHMFGEWHDAEMEIDARSTYDAQLMLYSEGVDQFKLIVYHNGVRVYA